LYWLSAWLDPAGVAGGPLLATSSGTCLNRKDGPNPLRGAFTWKTMPEVLQEHGVSWKFYGTRNFHPFGFTEYFAKFAQTPDASNPFYANGVLPTFEDFLKDAAAGRLPAVSWVLTDFDKSEHASFSPQAGIQQVAKALEALTTIPDRWASTVLFLTYDENGGFFDHVAPPTPPAGTEGEYITSTKPATSCLPLPSEATRAMPIGLGFRVPMLVISPYSRGGFVCSETFDHTSMLRFIETRHAASGMRVPNLSAWRRSITGDLTSALDLGNPPNLNLPTLPPTEVVACATRQFPVPDPQVMPRPPDKIPPRPSRTKSRSRQRLA
jgi:phospholipase C